VQEENARVKTERAAKAAERAARESSGGGGR
jgi:uncharacterized small protein (DUF1192 family)